MGLFENAYKRAQKLGLISRATRALPVISLLAALAGVVWLLVLPLEDQHRNTYISENALLPAQAMTYFRETEWHMVRGYREEVHRLEEASEQVRSAEIAQWFEDIGLKTSVHHWEVAYGSEIRNGTNVYAILHGPRGENTEAMVLAAPWLNEDGDYNDGGIALLAALARYFKKWSVWSKNIIFVASSDSSLALRSWVEAYHTSLENTAGDIEAAVVLDYAHKHDYFDLVDIQYEGLNGQLPNLDLVNTMNLIANHENLRVTIQGLTAKGDYQTRAHTLLRGIVSQVLSGLGPGPGGDTFSGWKIDAVTIKARGTGGPGDITTFGRLAESCLRSVNNLLEHFHQSFFFYLMLSPNRFVSIGTYLPCALLVANSFPLMAIFLLLNTSPGHGVHTRMLTPGIIAVLTFVFSLLCTHATLNLVNVAQATNLLAGLAVITCVGPLVMPHVLVLSRPILQYLHAYTLIMHGLFLTTLATTNFALALVMGLVTLPLAWVRPDAPRRRTLVLLLLSSPWAGIGVLCALKGTDVLTMVHDLLWGWRGLQMWTYLVLMTAWLPTWLLCMIASSSRSYEPISDNKKRQ